jgi:two-component system NtrC family sensor kinase
MTAPPEVAQNPSQPKSALTLRTIVELVRRIMHADVVSIVKFSAADQTITWKAASGFRSHVIDEDHPLVRPITNEIAQEPLTTDSLLILEGLGTSEGATASEFPVHAAEAIRDLALAPLISSGKNLGALMAGFRTPHQFTDDEKQLLQDLAAMAALVLDSARLVESITAAERIWEQTFNAIGEGIIVHDDQGQIVRCNGRASEMMEMKPAEVIGLSFSDAFARLFGKRAAAYHLPNAGAASTFEVQTECGRRYLVSMFPIKQPDGESVSVVTWSDVTRLSEMQEQLARSRRLASVGQLAAGVAHEINNPLAAITTCAEATMRDMRQSEDVRELADDRQWTYYLEEIVRQTLRCKDITRGLLDLTRQRQAHRVMCDLNAIARQCAKVALHRAAESNVEFAINLHEGIGEVATDAAMVRQILDNILTNAVDALGRHGGKITVSTLREGERVVIEVADTGHGIPADLLAKVFDPFFSTKGPGKGYGLGLAISLTLAESLGGALTVESKPNAGSRFRLWIPRRAPES